MKFVFEVNSYNELDHHSPVAEQLLELGNSVCFLLGDDPRLSSDPRLRYLSRWDDFEISTLSTLTSPLGHRVFKLLSRIFFGRFSAVWRTHQMRLQLTSLISRCLFVYRPHHSLKFDCAVSGWGDPSSLLMTSARARRKPIVALPHGYPCMKNTDFNPHIASLVSSGVGVDFSLRDQFDAYVVATERNKNLLREFQMSPDTIRVWGNARFSPRWVERLRQILPELTLQHLPTDTQKVLVLLPASTSGFHAEQLSTLLRRLAQENIVLILKPHTREVSSSTFIPADVLNSRNVVVAAGDHTTKLIEASDTVLNFATGTAIEALFLNRRFVFLRYLTANQLSWDDCNGIRKAASEDEVIRIVTDRTWNTDLSRTSQYIADEVFASGTVSDPPRHYAERLVQLAVSFER